MLEDKIIAQEQVTDKIINNMLKLEKRIENNLEEFEVMHKAFQQLKRELGEQVRETNNLKLLRKVRDGKYLLIDKETNRPVPADWK